MHARPDGVAIADRPSIAPANCVDASHDLEIGPGVAHLRLLVAAGFVTTLLSASLAFEWWGNISTFDATIGYAGVALFGTVTAWLVWMLPTERGPIVIVTAYGIRDLRIGNEFLLWDLIAGVSAEEIKGRKVIVLRPTAGLQRQLSCIRAGARNDRIVIRSEGLATDFETLLCACHDCHAASNQATALHQEDERGTQGIALQAT